MLGPPKTTFGYLITITSIPKNLFKNILKIPIKLNQIFITFTLNFFSRCELKYVVATTE
jgi:hypothetical protein